MPRNQFQRLVFALITVVITVHAYVFYSLYVVNGNVLMQINGINSVIAALENFMGSPLSFKLACRVFNPAKNHPMIFETAIICATVGLMCPAMSFIAAWLYYPYYAGFNVFTLLANWSKLVCFNFPFAYFTQLFFVQPVVRVIFKALFRKDIEARNQEPEHPGSENEQETIADIFRRMDEIQEEVAHEHRRRKALEETINSGLSKK